MKALWKFAVLILGSLLLSMQSTTSAQEVERIKISVLYGFWHEDSAQISPSVQIVHKQDDYFLCFPADSKNCTQPVDKNLVRRLVDAVSKPPLEHLDISRFGITQEGLNARVRQAYQTRKSGFDFRHKWSGERCEPPLCSGSIYKQIFNKNYSDMEEVDNQFKSYYYGLEDAHGGVGFSVTLAFQDGDIWNLRSFNQRHFLLPWTIDRSGKKFETYAPDIAQAVYDLVPETHFKSKPDNSRDKALYALQFNRKWLVTDPYNFWMNELMIHSVLRDLKIANTLQLIGGKSKIIQSQFNILEMTISSSGVKGKYSLWGLWEKKELLPKIKIKVSADIDLKNPDSISNLVEQTNARIQHILNINWFRGWLEENKSNIDHWRIAVTRPGGMYEDVDMASIYLQKYKYETWVSKIKKQRDEMVAISVEHEAWPPKNLGKYSEWLVFPNGEMILWVTNREQVHTWSRSRYGFQTTKQENYYGRDGIINHIVHFDDQGQMTVHYRDPSGPCYFPPPFKYSYSNCPKNN